MYNLHNLVGTCRFFNRFYSQILVIPESINKTRREREREKKNKQLKTNLILDINKPLVFHKKLISKMIVLESVAK